MITTNPTDFQTQTTLRNYIFNQTPEAQSGPATKFRWPGLMNLTTLAEYLDMSVTTVSGMIKTGQLPPATVAPTPRLKRWSRASIDAHFQKAIEVKAGGPSIDDLMARPSAKYRGSH